ncbi:MAG: META domain-containing protein, partial [Geminicoccaceae bacterium]
PFFEIKGTGIKGFDGCNRFFGSLDKPGAISSTRRACPESTLKLPLDLSDLDAHLQTGCIKGDQFTIPASGRYPSSTYMRQLGASAAPGDEPSSEAKPGAQPAAAPSEGVGPDPHKRGGFKAVQDENKAKLREAEARPGTKPGEGCDSSS